MYLPGNLFGDVQQRFGLRGGGAAGAGALALADFLHRRKIISTSGSKTNAAAAYLAQSVIADDGYFEASFQLYANTAQTNVVIAFLAIQDESQTNAWLDYGWLKAAGDTARLWMRRYIKKNWTVAFYIGAVALNETVNYAYNLEELSAVPTPQRPAEIPVAREPFLRTLPIGLRQRLRR